MTHMARIPIPELLDAQDLIDANIRSREIAAENGLLDTQAVVENAGALSVRDGGNVSAGAVATVAESLVSRVTLEGTAAIIKNSSTYPVTGGTVSVAVAAGVPTFTFTPGEEE